MPVVGDPIAVGSDFIAVAGNYYRINSSTLIALPDPNNLNVHEGFFFEQSSGSSSISTGETLLTVNANNMMELPEGEAIWVAVKFIYGRKEYAVGFPDGSSSALSGGVTTSDIEVFDVVQGSYKDDDVIPAGTTLEDIIKNMLTSVIPPVYTIPTASLEGTQSGLVEVGTLINPTITPTYNQNDGGIVTEYRLLREGSNIFTNANAVPHVDTSFNIGDETVTYSAEIDYAQGPVKLDNIGNPNPTGQIPAGMLISSFSDYVGKRKSFYGIDGTVGSIRTLDEGNLDPADGDIYTLDNVSGNNVVIAYPATLQDITSVTISTSGFTFELVGSSDFVEHTGINVSGANGYTPVLYKVYVYEPSAAFVDATFTIEI